MPMLTADDDVELYYEDTGSGTPIVFVHEFAGDYRSWAPQVHHFARRYRCITYNARGYPPSAVPDDPQRYSQQRARDDIRCVLDALSIDRAHVVGLSMGAFATLHFGMSYPSRPLSLVVAGCGYGAHPDQRAHFQADSQAMARAMLEKGMQHMAETYGHRPARLQLRDKDPDGFAEFIRLFAEHSARGSANTMRGYQAQRPSLYDLAGEMRAITAPLLIVAGDEDDATLEPSLLMKRTIATAALAVLPKSGHALNLEEPALFNRLVEDFIHTTESGRWVARVPEAPGSQSR
ncbi:MAG: alpha/beta hydrolase [Gammaproteobacteria bacterium]|nr:alpha/beta hydrolase [Gammaproteobacteria bacterium]